MSSPKVDPERNRAILAERAGWPDGALEAVRDLEAAAPDGYYAWWSRGDLPSEQGPGFYARTQRDAPNRPSLYAPTADELAALIASDAASRPAYRW